MCLSSTSQCKTETEIMEKFAYVEALDFLLTLALDFYLLSSGSCRSFSFSTDFPLVHVEASDFLLTFL